MTTPKPVSPAPDTEELRQQVADVWPDPLGNWTADEADVAHAMKAALLPLITDLAEREAGLRAALEHAQRTGDEIAAIAAKRGDDREALSELLRGMARRASEQRREARQWYVDAQNAEQFLRYASDKKVAEYREDVRASAFPRLFGRGHPVPPVPSTPEELAALEARPARAGARTIPDDAAEQVAQCLSDYWISLRGRRQDADETEHGQAEDVDRLVRSWLAPTTGPAPAAADGPDRHDADVTEDPEEPGWYIATCSACDWTTNGKESVVEDAADQHFSQAVLGVGRQASTTNPFWRLTVTELHTVLHANLLMASGCTGGSDCPAKLHAHGCALDPCTPATTSPVPAPADRPMPADEKPVLAHTSGWQGVVERAALRCCDVDGRNWNLVSETDRDRYRQYGMAMFRALPPHIAGQMHEPPPASVDRCCPACAADIEKVEAERGDGIQPDPWRCTLCGWTGQEWDLAAREDTAPPDDDCNDNLTAGFLRAPVGACSCRPTAAVIHVSGTYCGDAQYEQAVDAMRAAVGRSGDERDEEAVSAVLGYLANPTPEEKP